MNKFIRKLSIEWVLRTSLGLMYVFSGLDMFRNPKAWYWAVKPLGSMVYKIGVDNYLKIQGIAELVFAGILLISFIPRTLVAVVAGLTVIEMAAILFLIGIDAITFRDISILGASLALYILLISNSKSGASSGIPKPETKKSSLPVNTDTPVVQTFDEFIKS